jgi:hypothetical protein
MKSKELSAEWDTKNMMRRVNRAMKFPINTDPCSRHVRIMAECLMKGSYPMFQEEPEHCAQSLLATLEALYKARNELAKLKG